MPTPSVVEASSGSRYFSVEPEQPGEAAEAADDLGAGGARDLGLHQLDGAVTRLDVDAGRGVGGWLAHGRPQRVGAALAAEQRLGRGASRWAPSAGHGLRPMPSSTCLPIRSCSGSGIG